MVHKPFKSASDSVIGVFCRPSSRVNLPCKNSELLQEGYYKAVQLGAYKVRQEQAYKVDNISLKFRKN